MAVYNYMIFLQIYKLKEKKLQLFQRLSSILLLMKFII
jgi:hypothetical protein